MNFTALITLYIPAIEASHSVSRKLGYQAIHSKQQDKVIE